MNCPYTRPGPRTPGAVRHSGEVTSDPWEGFDPQLQAARVRRLLWVVTAVAAVALGIVFLPVLVYGLMVVSYVAGAFA